MATTSLQTNYTEIRKAIALLSPWNRDPTKWSSEATADASAIIRRGLARFYNPPDHRWSFLRPEYSLITSPPYSTGTIEAINGVATLTGGAFPSWAADGWIYIGGVPYDVATRDGNTQLTLTNTDLDADAGSSYVLRRYRYELPAGFVGFVGAFNYAPKATNRVIEMTKTAEHVIRRYYTVGYWGNSAGLPPCMYAITTGGDTPTTGTKHYLIVWPPGEEAHYLVGNINLVPQDLDDTNLYPMGGEAHGRTILEAILAEAELHLHGSYGDHNAAFLECLAISIASDKETKSPDTLGVIPESGDHCLDRRAGDWWIYPAGFEDQIIP